MKKKHYNTTNGAEPNYSWSRFFNICCSPEEAFEKQRKEWKKSQKKKRK